MCYYSIHRDGFTLCSLKITIPQTCMYDNLLSKLLNLRQSLCGGSKTLKTARVSPQSGTKWALHNEYQGELNFGFSRLVQILPFPPIIPSRLVMLDHGAATTDYFPFSHRFEFIRGPTKMQMFLFPRLLRRLLVSNCPPGQTANTEPSGGGDRQLVPASAAYDGSNPMSSHASSSLFDGWPCP